MWVICEDSNGGRIHIVPMLDDKEHIPSASCWCKPEQYLTDPLLWGHNSADGREAYETGERRVH